MVNEFEEYYEVDERLYRLLVELKIDDFRRTVLDTFTVIDKLNKLGLTTNYYELLDIETDIMETLLGDDYIVDEYPAIIRDIMKKHLKAYFRMFFIIVNEESNLKLYNYRDMLIAIYHTLTTDENMAELALEILSTDDDSLDRLLILFSNFGNVNVIEYYDLVDDVADSFLNSIVRYLETNIKNDYSIIDPYLNQVLEISEKYKDTVMFTDIINGAVNFNSVDSYIGKFYYTLGLYNGDVEKISREIAIYAFYMTEYACAQGYQIVNDELDISDIDNVGDIFNIKDIEDKSALYINELCNTIKK